MVLVCRTCLIKTNDQNAIWLSGSTASLQIKTELSACVPELSIDLIANPVLCTQCVAALHAAYDFKSQCLQSEKQILNYMQRVASNVSLQELCQDGMHLSFPLQVANTLDDSTFLPKNRNIIEDLNNLLDDALDDIQIQTTRADRNDTDMNDVIYIADVDSGEESCVEKTNVANNKDQIIAAEQANNRLVQNSPKSNTPPQKLAKNFFSKKPKTEVTMSTAYKRNNDLRWHRSRKNSNKIKNTAGKIETKKKNHFTCSTCGFTTTGKRKLIYHLTIHRNSGHFRCTVCEFRSASSSSLKNHMLLHNKVKVFKCNVCQYKAAWNSALKIHQRKHTGEKPFGCTICSRKFAITANLKRHLQVKHGVVV